jgi:hypothetical protein
MNPFVIQCCAYLYPAAFTVSAKHPSALWLEAARLTGLYALLLLLLVHCRWLVGATEVKNIAVLEGACDVRPAGYGSTQSALVLHQWLAPGRQASFAAIPKLVCDIASTPWLHTNTLCVLP